MASITTYDGGIRRIQFLNGAKQRRSIRLGKVTDERAREIKAKVEALNADAIAGQAWEPELARWVARQEKPLYDKLAAVGLVPPREIAAPKMLGAFLDAYIESRVDVKPNTRAHLLRARKDLIEFFGADRRLHSITAGDADEFRLWLLKPKPVLSRKTGKKIGERRLHDNTVRRICGRAKQFFRAAQRKRLIVESPFGDMQGTGVQANKSRDHFVTRDVAAKVLKACPDAQWQLLFALSRYGGLRCPSEHLALRWSDVDWKRSRLTIRSPKTEHHEGKESRVIPLFPELRPYLKAVFDEAPEDTEFVITRYRHRNANLRTQLERIIRKVGLKPWPKLFQNLRSTRETELAEQFPIHVVCEWIGNSRAVATKHYLQITETHFEAAVHQEKSELSAPPGSKTAPQVVHSPVPGVANVGKASQRRRANSEKYAGSRKSLVVKAPPVGAEQPQDSSGNTAYSHLSGAQVAQLDELTHLLTHLPDVQQAVVLDQALVLARAFASRHSVS